MKIKLLRRAMSSSGITAAAAVAVVGGVTFDASAAPVERPSVGITVLGTGSQIRSQLLASHGAQVAASDDKEGEGSCGEEGSCGKGDDHDHGEDE